MRMSSVVDGQGSYQNIGPILSVDECKIREKIAETSVNASLTNDSRLYPNNHKPVWIRVEDTNGRIAGSEYEHLLHNTLECFNNDANNFSVHEPTNNDVFNSNKPISIQTFSSSEPISKQFLHGVRHQIRSTPRTAFDKPLSSDEIANMAYRCPENVSMLSRDSVSIHIHGTPKRTLSLEPHPKSILKSPLCRVHSDGYMRHDVCNDDYRRERSNTCNMIKPPRRNKTQTGRIDCDTFVLSRSRSDKTALNIKFQYPLKSETKHGFQINASVPTRSKSDTLSLSNGTTVVKDSVGSPISGKDINKSESLHITPLKLQGKAFNAHSNSIGEKEDRGSTKRGKRNGTFTGVVVGFAVTVILLMSIGGLLCYLASRDPIVSSDEELNSIQQYLATQNQQSDNTWWSSCMEQTVDTTNSRNSIRVSRRALPSEHGSALLGKAAVVPPFNGTTNMRPTIHRNGSAWGLPAYLAGKIKAKSNNNPQVLPSASDEYEHQSGSIEREGLPADRPYRYNRVSSEAQSHAPLPAPVAETRTTPIPDLHKQPQPTIGTARVTDKTEPTQGCTLYLLLTPKHPEVTLATNRSTILVHHQGAAAQVDYGDTHRTIGQPSDDVTAEYVVTVTQPGRYTVRLPANTRFAFISTIAFG